MTEPTTTTTPRVRPIYTVKQFAERNPCVTESGLRFQIFNRKTNGLEASGALLRIGRKLLIDEDKYFNKWVDSLQKKF